MKTSDSATKMSSNSRKLAVIGTMIVIGTNSSAFAADTIEINGAAVDHASLGVPAIDSNARLQVHTFNSSHAKLGQATHSDTAQRAASAVPHLLAADLVEALRARGFADVILDDAESDSAEPQMLLHGRFTEINPGSQATRVWIGFGAGESKVCVDGVLSDRGGQQLGYFAHCAKGLGWGGSDDHLDQDASRISDSIATFLAGWAQGVYRVKEATGQ